MLIKFSIFVIDQLAQVKYVLNLLDFQTKPSLEICVFTFIDVV